MLNLEMQCLGMVKCKATKGAITMPGKATRPDDGRHQNKGGGGGKGGRPVGSVSPRGQRGIHQIRAYEDEWGVIKDFMMICRKDIDKCRFAVEMLKRESGQNEG